MRTDNPCLSWTSFYPAQAPGIFHWPGQARPLSGVRDQREALHDPGGWEHGVILTAVCHRCSVRLEGETTGREGDTTLNIHPLLDK